MTIPNDQDGLPGRLPSAPVAKLQAASYQSGPGLGLVSSQAWELAPTHTLPTATFMLLD